MPDTSTWGESLGFLEVSSLGSRSSLSNSLQCHIMGCLWGFRSRISCAPLRLFHLSSILLVLASNAIHALHEQCLRKVLRIYEGFR
jgi:hypothetical protein